MFDLRSDEFGFCRKNNLLFYEWGNAEQGEILTAWYSHLGN